MGRSALRLQSLHDPRGRDDLPHVPLRVLGGMDQQADHRRRQLEAADAPRFEQSGFRGIPKLSEGAVDLPFKG